MKTAKLNGAALDWAVAKCEDVALVDGCIFTKDPDDDQVLYSPSSDWAQGGPIIEREGIEVSVSRRHKRGHIEEWTACNESVDDQNWDAYIQTGETPLVAAMRCYVASRLGAQIEIPKELK
jgi:hypothetical protein